jgi:hypothetical protein
VLVDRFAAHNNSPANMSQSDDDDDYMNMTFEDAPKGPKYETSLQRAARKRKEVRHVSTTRLRVANNCYRAKQERDRRPRQSAKQTQKQREKQHWRLRCPKQTRALR